MSVDKPPEREKESLETDAYDVYTGECEICGSAMYGLHCKIICPNCGYRRDCSDP